MVQAVRGRSVPVGWNPDNLRAAYNFPSTTRGQGQTVAVVDAYDNPHVASDLAKYRSYFGMPPAQFTKYNQEGKQGHYPQGAKGWGSEIDLDVEMISAICPNCAIDLIEAKTNSIQNLFMSERTAVALGATIISNSWGNNGGFPSSNAFDTPGVTYVASSGDGGYGSQDPADYDRVVSVGGTVLREHGGVFSESVWEDTGAGCSTIKKPFWQHDPSCKKRTGNDVSAVAQNVSFYDTYGYDGWGTSDGTSDSAPIIAAAFALAGDSTKQHGGRTFWMKHSHPHALHYISSGTVAGCPPSLQGSYLCTAGTGEFETYSGPAGWGTPNGIGAF